MGLGGGTVVAAQHAGQFGFPFPSADGFEIGTPHHSAAARVDDDMVVGERSHLGQVGDHDDLVGAGQSGQS